MNTTRATTFAIGESAIRLPPGMRTIMYKGSGSPVVAITLRAALLYTISIVVAITNSNRVAVTEGPQWNVLCDALHTFGQTCHADDVIANNDIFLLRDYATLYHIWMIAAVSVWAGMLNTKLATIIPDLRANSAIKRIPRALVVASVRTANRRVSSRVTHVMILALAITSGGLGLYGYLDAGIYASLAPPGVDSYAFAQQSAQDWWIAASWVSKAWFMVVATIGNYVNWWTCFVAIEVTIAVWRARHLIDFRLETTNRDGDWGWSPVSSVVRIGSRCVIASMVGLLGIALLANFRSIQYLAIFPIALIIAVVPFLAANAVYARAADLSRVWWRQTSGSSRQIEAISYSSAPKRIFPLGTILFQAAFAVAPALLGFWQSWRDAHGG